MRLYVQEKLSNNTRAIVSLFAVIFATVICGSRLLGSDLDYLAYIELFQTRPSDNVRFYEPFTLLMQFINMELNPTNDVTYIFYIYAFISSLIKVIVFARFSRFFLVSILFYAMHFYLLHEYTQIRAAISIGIVLYALHFIHQPKKYVLLIVAAGMFHFTSFLFFVLYYPIRRMSIDFLAAGCFVVFILAGSIHIFDLMNFAEVTSIVRTLGFSIGHVEDFNILNRINLSYLLLGFSAYAMHRFEYLRENQMNEIYIKAVLLGSTVFYLFGSFGLIVLSYRLSYMLYPVLALLVPSMLLKIRSYGVGYVSMALYSIVVFGFLSTTLLR